MDKNYLEKLEFDKIILSLTNFCNTYIGKEISQKLIPYTRPDKVKNVLQETR